MRVIVLAHLELDDYPIAAQRFGSELLEQDCLAGATESGDDHGLPGATARDASEQKIEGPQLVIATDHGLGLSPSVGSVGVCHGLQSHHFT